MLTVHTPAKQKCSPVSCYFSYSAILMAAYRHGPLRERVVKSSSVSSSTGVSQFLPLRPIRYKGWSHESMKAAMKAVIDDGMSIRDAAEQYGVPTSTLGDRISGRVLPGATSGPRTFLTSDEEEDVFPLPHCFDWARSHTPRGHCYCGASAFLSWCHQKCIFWLVGCFRWTAP